MKMIRYMAILVLLTSAGCATVAGTNLRENEKVQLTIQKKPIPGEKKGFIPGLSLETLKTVGKYVAPALAWVVEQEAKDYQGTYSAKAWEPNALTETTISSDGIAEKAYALNLTSKLTRSATATKTEALGAKPAVELTMDFVPVGSKYEYFQIQPKTLSFRGAKAKIAEAKYLNKPISMTVLVTVTFPETAKESKKTEYKYSFTVNGLRPGAGNEEISLAAMNEEAKKEAPQEGAQPQTPKPIWSHDWTYETKKGDKDKPTDGKYPVAPSDFFLVRSTGPVNIQVDVLECDNLKKWLDKGAAALKKLGKAAS